MEVNLIKLDDYIKRVIDKLKYKIVPSHTGVGFDVVDENTIAIATLYTFITDRPTIDGGVIHHNDGDINNWESKNLRQFKSKKTYNNYMTALDKARLVEKKKKIKPRPRLGNAYKKYKGREK